mmetsp:Transcript_21985/g.42825  ORF Transcript_21985/g.42825 Transcript_21985/m.42825 type:complete len:204 (-) Transcript_21985:422-1033(-)
MALFTKEDSVALCARCKGTRRLVRFVYVSLELLKTRPNVELWIPLWLLHYAILHGPMHRNEAGVILVFTCCSVTLLLLGIFLLFLLLFLLFFLLCLFLQLPSLTFIFVLLALNFNLVQMFFLGFIFCLFLALLLTHVVAWERAQSAVDFVHNRLERFKIRLVCEAQVPLRMSVDAICDCPRHILVARCARLCSFALGALLFCS